MRRQRAWVMPDEDARSLLQQIEERIRASNIEVEHRDILIRLRSLIEEDLGGALRLTSILSPHQGPNRSGEAQTTPGLDRLQPLQPPFLVRQPQGLLRAASGHSGTPDLCNPSMKRSVIQG